MRSASRTGSGGSAKTGPAAAVSSRDFAAVSPRKSSKDAVDPTSTSPAKGGVPEQAEWVANARPAPLEKSPRHQQSQPQRPGHARTESHLGHGGAPGKTSSPVKGRAAAAAARPKSMVLDGRFY